MLRWGRFLTHRGSPPCRWRRPWSGCTRRGASFTWRSRAIAARAVDKPLLFLPLFRLVFVHAERVIFGCGRGVGGACLEIGVHVEIFAAGVAVTGNNLASHRELAGSPFDHFETGVGDGPVCER